MKKQKKVLAIIMAALMAFSMFTATATVAFANDVTSSVSGYMGFAEKFAMDISNFFVSLKYFFQRLSGGNITVTADDASDFTVATDGDTITLTKDLSTPNVNISAAVNLNLNGHTITCNSFTYNAGSNRNLYVKDGRIVAKNGNIQILAPQAALTLKDLTLVVVNSNAQKIIVDASTDTLILEGGFNTVDANENYSNMGEAIANGASAQLCVKGDTKVNVSSQISKPVNINVEGSNVIIENNSNAAGKIVVTESAAVPVTLVNNGTLREIAINTTNTCVTNKGSIENLTVESSEVSLHNDGSIANMDAISGFSSKDIDIVNNGLLEKLAVTSFANGFLTGFMDVATISILNNGRVTRISNDTYTQVIIEGNQPKESAGNILIPWDGVTLREITPENGTYYIADAQQLAWAAKQVNDGVLQNASFVLSSDIDLNCKEWTPIGTESSSFNGTFDGEWHKISNLKITRDETNATNNNYIGLFGKASGATISSFTLDNVNTSGSLYVAAVIGNADNCTVSGIEVSGDVNVKGWWYSGTVLGYGFSQVVSCSIDVSEGSSVSVTGGYAGGVIGFSCEGNKTVIDDCQSNIDVTGCYYGIGGLVGILNYGNTVKNSSCSSKITNVADEQGDRAPTGGICGSYDYLITETGEEYVATIDNCTFTGTLMDKNQIHTNYTLHPLYGCAYISENEGTIVIK